ncbi:MAG TPA: ankyrin repeat domain-containing protein, partial [Terriglobales bacterium]|nr:ankyrin repeat domain-containing protein [Terriglobales bacterium]
AVTPEHQPVSRIGAECTLDLASAARNNLFVPGRHGCDRMAKQRRAGLWHLSLSHYRGEVLWYLKLIHEFSVNAGREKDWQDPEWHMLDQGGYGSGARWHLRTATEHNDLDLARWCLEHGANPNSPPERDKRFPQRSLYEQALLLGETDMAELLARYGATRIDPERDSEDAFIAACFRRDREGADALIKQHPEYLKSPAALHMAAKQNRADVIEFLLDLGVSPEVENPSKATALHEAAYAGAAEAVDFLIRHGAKIDPVDSTHDATPLWWAMWAQRERVITMLAPYSRDVWALNFIGHLERVREVLAAEPRLATMTGESTPLFWLPDDEQKAVATVELFLSLGADASFRRKSDGLTAADVARRRQLHAAADLLDAF